MSDGISFCLKFFGFILSAVTTVFTVMLWGSLPEGIWSSILMGIAGFALEGSKFLLLLLALLFLKRKQFLASIVGGSLAALLFVVSIGASVGFLEKSEQQQQRSSEAWNSTQTSIAQIDEEIAMLLDSSRRDIENGYRERGLRTRNDIASLREQRETLLETPENAPVETSFGGLASMLGMEDDSVRLFAWLLLAVLIDGVAAACWAFLMLLRQSETVATALSETETVSETVATALSETETVSETVATALPETETVSETMATVSEKIYTCSSAPKAPVIIHKQDDLFDQVKRKIVEGHAGYDSSMSLNQLMRLESIGYSKARRIMDRLNEL